MTAPVAELVAGAPFQPGQRVRIVAAVDSVCGSHSGVIGSEGCVDVLVYCGCRPGCPLIDVRLDDGQSELFLPEELAAC